MDTRPKRFYSGWAWICITWTLGAAGCSSAGSTTTTSDLDAGDNADEGVPPAPSSPPSPPSPDASVTPIPLPTIDAGPLYPPVTPPACGGFGSSDACNACAQSTCCSQGSACGASAECEALFACIQGCTTGDVTCTTDCQAQSPDGVTPLQNFVNCLSTDCASACGGSSPAAGIGDHCQTSADCASGSCNNYWCTKPCTQNTQCASTPQSITDAVGELVWCVETSAGAAYCFPGCSTNAD